MYYVFIVPPVFDLETVTPRNLSVVIGNTLFISCPMSGIPPPKITWYKNGEVVSPDLDPNIRIYAEGRRLELTSARVTDLGLYRCEGVNAAGNNHNEYEVEVYGMSDLWVQSPFNFSSKEIKSLDIFFIKLFIHIRHHLILFKQRIVRAVLK